jgi:DNA-binding NarL/FixJ family response regulator
MNENLTKSKGPLFLITIQNVSDNPVIDPTRLKEEYGLTNREVEIVDYTQKGLKNSEIAGMLCISEGTVKNHLKSIFRKVGVDNRASLIHETLPI